jgi:transposase
VVSYSAERAARDRAEREEAISKIGKKMAKSKNPRAYLSGYGYKKYLNIEGAKDILIDEQRVERDARWDGLHGVITNAKDICDVDVLAQYNNLWNVEDAFRVTKHDLKVRPVFHWKPKRIAAHLAISFAAYALVKYMEYRVKLQYIKLSPEKIRQALIRVQISILFDRKKRIRYGLPSKMSKEARKIYNILGIKRSLTPYIIEKV